MRNRLLPQRIEARTHRRRPGPEPVEGLRRRHDNDDAHAEHVARLALLLFDATRSVMKAPRSERRLLKAAAMLHDLGYASDPDGHSEAGARIALAQGLRRFTKADRAVIAAAIRMHAGPYAGGRRTVAARDPSRRARVVAAFLRVADGLDHGHVQNASIRSVKRRESAWLVRVSSPGYSGNIGWADGKADLWRAVLPAGIEFREERDRIGAALFHGVVRSGDSAASAAGRILKLQYRLAEDARTEILAGGAEARCLHDLRVALNRFRMALRLFRPLMKGLCSKSEFRELSACRRRLGPIRDLQAWAEFLESRNVRRAMRNEAGWAQYVERVREDAEESRRNLVRMLGDRRSVRLARQLAGIARVRVPRMERDSKSPPLAVFAGRRIERACKRLWKKRRIDRDITVESIHELRRRCRRIRYWQEFAAPAQGGEGARLARIWSEVTHALGLLHDLDVRLAPGGCAREAPDRLAVLMKKMRAGAFASFRGQWNTAAGGAPMRRARKLLAGAGGKDGDQERGRSSRRRLRQR